MEYTYSDITNPILDRLQNNINLSAIVDKSGLYISWSSNDEILHIYFDNTLSSGDETILDNIVANHDNVLLNFKVNNKTSINENLDINLLGYYKENIFDNKGLLITKNYYKNYDGETYSDLVIKDEYEYTLNENDLVSYRDETISWYLTDNSVGYTKTFRKYYNLTQAICEGVYRRTNLLNKAKVYGFVNISGTHASGIPNSYYWFSTMKTEVNDYIDGTKKQDLLDFIDNETETYVTQTIKDAMTGILDYWTA